MEGVQRREVLLAALREAEAPLSGAALAGRFGVSRQVIVQDIALLRTSGAEITSTNRGYVLAEATSATLARRPSRLFKVRHTPEQVADELNAIVDLGATVENVMVNHRTYGRLSAPLNIKSRRDVQHFLSDLAQGISSPLMALTDGYHFHLVSADIPEVLDEVEAALSTLGFLAPLTDFERAGLPAN